METRDVEISIKKMMVRDGTVLFCSGLSSCILFSPAKHFGKVAVAFLTHGAPTAPYAENFGIFSGLASVGATTILGFNAWDKILSLPEKSFKALLKRFLFYSGGFITSAPLMVDTFLVNQNTLTVAPNLIVTVLPGMFMSGVYGQAIEFLYDELSGKNIDQHLPLEAPTASEKSRIRLALGIGTTVGTISAVGCYWESLNILTRLNPSPLTNYTLSALPVIFRAPLFIKSTYNLSYKLIHAIDKKEKPSCGKFSLLVFILAFSLFTIGGYSDITHSGMTQSSLYKSSVMFRDVVFPGILSVAMLSMLFLNADALVTACDKIVKKCASDNRYGRFFTLQNGSNSHRGTTPLLKNDSINEETPAQTL